MEFEGEREGDEDVINPKRERIALCAREANVRSYTVHPKGEAFLAGGLEVPREESFQGVTGIQKGAKGEIEIPLPPFALAGEAARPQATCFEGTLL